MLLYILFFLPILEVVAFILVAKAIGWTSTLLLALATSFIGAALLRANAGSVGEARNSFSAQAIENYLFYNLGCFFLILPGFITDILGLALTIPPARAALIYLSRLCRFDVRKNASGPFSVFRAYRFGNGPGFSGSGARSGDDFWGLNEISGAFRRGTDDDSIDVETVAQNESDAKNLSDDEPIDVEYTIRK